MIRLLDNEDALSDRTPAGQHAHHLLGLALAHTGAIDAARRTWRAGLERTGACPIADLLDATEQPVEAPPATAPCTVHVAWARKRGAEALDEGDPAAAAAALDRPPLWATEDRGGLETLARALDVQGPSSFRRLLVEAALAGSEDAR